MWEPLLRGCREGCGDRARAVCVTWDQELVQGYGTPKLLLSPARVGGPSMCRCPAWLPCPGTLPSLGMQAALHPRARMLRAPAVPPCPAAPGIPKSPSRTTRAFVPFLGSESGVSDKGGSGGGGWCSSSFPAGTKAKQTESVSVSVSVPIPCPCPCPCPHCSHGWCGGGQCPGGGHRAPPAWVPVGSDPSPTRAPSHLGSAPGSPRSPACRWHRGDGFSAGRAVAMAACPRCHLLSSLCAAGVAVVAQAWPWSLGMSHPRRMGRSSALASPPQPRGVQWGPRGDGERSPGEPGFRGRIRPGRSRAEGFSGGCHLSPSPRVPRNLP